MCFAQPFRQGRGQVGLIFICTRGTAIFKFFTKNHTLRVKIITLFLSLTIVAFAVVITFTYSRNYKQIMVFARELAEKVNLVILEKFNSIAMSAERLSLVTGGFFFDVGPINPQNKVLRSFMLNVINSVPNYTNFFIGLDNGNHLEALNLKTAGQTTYNNPPHKPLPSSVAFALRYVDHTAFPPTDTWYYLNDQFQIVTVEQLINASYDSTERPWYQGAARTRGLYWTDFYNFEPSNERGISVGYPVFDASGKVVAVVGADLTFVQLANFLSEQVIGKTGKAFMVDKNAEVIIPDIAKLENSTISGDLVYDVIKWYGSNPKQSFFTIKNNGIEYLAYVNPVPVIFGQDWRIVIIAPVNDFFAELMKMQRDAILIIVGILIISSLIIAYFAQQISAPIVVLANEVNKITQLKLDSDVRVKSNIKEIFLIDASIAAMRLALRSFASYVPIEVVRDLFKRGEQILLGGEKKKLRSSFPILRVLPLLRK